MLKRMKKAYLVDFALKNKNIHDHFTSKMGEAMPVALQLENSIL